MLFHEKTRRRINVGFIVVGILVIVSMMLLYFPALSQR
jgi:predicted nucleic acid-binding Zn ribbon protein